MKVVSKNVSHMNVCSNERVSTQKISNDCDLYESVANQQVSNEVVSNDVVSIVSTPNLT